MQNGASIVATIKRMDLWKDPDGRQGDVVLAAVKAWPGDGGV
jgi:hypothetical protein